MTENLVGEITIHTRATRVADAHALVGTKAHFLAELESLMRRYGVDRIEIGWAMPKPCERCGGAEDEIDMEADIGGPPNMASLLDTQIPTDGKNPHIEYLTEDGLCRRCANKPEKCTCEQNDRAMRAAGKDALGRPLHGQTLHPSDEEGTASTLASGVERPEALDLLGGIVDKLDKGKEDSDSLSAPVPTPERD